MTNMQAAFMKARETIKERLVVLKDRFNAEDLKRIRRLVNPLQSGDTASQIRANEMLVASSRQDIHYVHQLAKEAMDTERPSCYNASRDIKEICELQA